MSAEKRNCQNEEGYEDCATREYLRRVKERCFCVPENLIEQEDDGDLQQVLDDGELRQPHMKRQTGTEQPNMILNKRYIRSYAISRR